MPATTYPHAEERRGAAGARLEARAAPDAAHFLASLSPPPDTLVLTQRAPPMPVSTLASQAGAHGIAQNPIADHLNAGLVNMVGQLCTLERGMVGHPERPVGRHCAQFGSIASRVHEEASQSG